ncbi:MAG: 50S ribosomal protein L17 [Candidatus Pacebacteria bacterium]|nr:50S ribosomal protein L17 [Candidatus Paceibacterota bacterium]
MRHGRKNRKFGRKANVRRGFIRSLAVALLTYEQIKTTEARAKELRPYIEKLITKAKKGDVASRRLIRARLGNQESLANKLVDDIAPRYADRNGGYTRIIKMPARQGDASPMAIIEFVK